MHIILIDQHNKCKGIKKDQLLNTFVYNGTVGFSLRNVRKHNSALYNEPNNIIFHIISGNVPKAYLQS